MNWSNQLDDFGRNLLRHLGCDPEWLPWGYNPVTQALRDRDLVAELEGEEWFSKRTCRIKFSRVATVCQMNVYDNNGGPDGEGKPKALRRSWYAWYKTEFAQHLSRQLGEDGFNGTLWAGRMSKTYSEFVDEGGVTYRDLWVDDASRMMERFWDVLFNGCNVVLAVEKDSLFADFIPAAKALGARTLVSGKGKQSKAATEKLLREHFDWSQDWDPFTEETPLVVLHLSDHDYDGEDVIGPTFGEQCRRYTEHVLEARVGIKPCAIERNRWPEHWYDVKVTNRGYINWSKRKALFLAKCLWCGYEWPVQSASVTCPSCGERQSLVVKDGRQIINQPKGFEVEALPTRAYYALVVDALLQVLDFDYIVAKLREECKADAWDAASRIAEEIYEDNDSFQALMKEFDRLEAIKSEFTRRVEEALRERGEPHVSDWAYLEEDPDPEDFRDYVHQADQWAEPWSPFSVRLRTDKLVEWLKENEEDIIDDLKEEEIEF